MPLCSLTEKFKLCGSVEKIFRHFTDTDQIPLSFQPALKVQIGRRTSRHMAQGTSFEVQTWISFLSIRWKAYVHSFNTNRHITCLLENRFFSSWEHDIYFEQLPGNQTRVTECLLYRMPCGALGGLINRLLVRPCLRRFFACRTSNLIRAFQEAKTNLKENPLSSGPGISAASHRLFTSK